MTSFPILLGLALLGCPAGAELRTWSAKTAGDFEMASVEGVRVHPDSLVILAALSGEKNLALGRPVIDELENLLPLTDGSIAAVRSEWSSGTPQVFGRSFLLDLGVDRAITRLRILAGETAVFSRPEYFVRGYRIEAAEQAKPDFWRKVAEARENFTLNVDTELDGTWLAFGPDNRPRPTVARFVRLTLTRQDRSNWVVLGEIEVYGIGYDSRGDLTGRFSSQEPVNVGRVRWQAETGAKTWLQIRVRGLYPDGESSDWDLLSPLGTQNLLFFESEPVADLEYRITLATVDPFATPALTSLEIDYDPMLVADQVYGSVLAESVILGERSTIGYRAQIGVGPDNYGVDLVRLDGAAIEVTEMRFDGTPLSFTQLQDPGTVLELSTAQPLVVSGRLEIEGIGVFAREVTPLVLSVGSRDQAVRDGYVNWQRGKEYPQAVWTVRAGGPPLGLISRVEIGQRPFLPVAGEELAFRFIVGQVLEQSEFRLRLFNLIGREVRTLRRTGSAGEYRMSWDGRDGNGRLVDPGLYLYEISVESRGSTGRRRGSFAVAY